MGFILPDRMHCKLKFQHKVILSSTATNTYFYSFRGNDIFDPDYTGSGGQPSGSDQWSAFYSRWYVAASKIKVVLLSGKTDNEGAEFYLIPTSVPWSSTLTANSLPEELPNGRGRIIGGINSSGNLLTLKHYMTTKKITGRPGTKWELNYTGTSAKTGPDASPTNIWYWNYVYKNLSSGDNDTIFQSMFIITYYVDFFNRHVLDIS